MIITELTGGLGNQLFQYAAGRALATARHTELKLNLKNFQDYKLHSYSLLHFNITAPVASDAEVQNLSAISTLVFDLMKLKPYYKRSVYREKFFHVDGNFWKAPDNVMLRGYWQSEKYFQSIRTALLQEFSLKTKPTEASTKTASDISDSNAISLHIRRGDYVQNPKFFKEHGVCSIQYYETCATQFAERIKDPVFFVFSDDPQWVKDNLKLKLPMVFVDHNDAAYNFEDMWLMSLCKHNIIANSSFSWWGAWLNTNENKIVMAPSRWFNDSARDTRDIIPASWLKIK